MRVLVDADACPVKEIVVRISKSYHIEVIMVVDTSHEIEDGYSQVVTVEKAKDSVDIALINRTCSGDLVVTQDYGVAAMALAKGAIAMNQNGLIFSDKNIDRLLLERHIGNKIRRAGGRTTNFKKRNKENNQRFEIAFRDVMEKVQK